MVLDVGPPGRGDGWSSGILEAAAAVLGYVAPEYASTGMLNERSDMYSFGILIMEIITGRNPADYSRPPEEVNLIEWLKKMVANRNPEGVYWIPSYLKKPTSRALKRALLVALRCVDSNPQKRPNMAHVIHMLEAEESPSKDDNTRAGRDAGHYIVTALRMNRQRKWWQTRITMKLQYMLMVHNHAFVIP
ncbi:putative receptor-like protein kinase [Hibiscus syriacus]|uniref:non-specific serine/threonine protein kinase n=1 Tax=Hibiscus syriacus TaxID=106335 RepID=A0A6A2WDC5_HIBSY|nr:putative receptor-like protein kinase [Hibiscus syriacus]